MQDCSCPALGGGLLAGTAQLGQHKPSPNSWVPSRRRIWLYIGGPRTSKAALAAQTGSPCCSPGSGIWLAKGLSGLSRCIGALVRTVNESKLYVVLGACAGSGWEILPRLVQLSSGHPWSCKGLQSLRHFHTSGVCLEEEGLTRPKASDQHGREQFGPGSGGKVWHSERIQKLQSEPFPSVQTAMLPGWEGHIHRGAQRPPLPPAGSLAGDTKQPR